MLQHTLMQQKHQTMEKVSWQTPRQAPTMLAFLIRLSWLGQILVAEQVAKPC